MAVTCPSCSAPLSAPPACAACGLLLVGPLAQRLWEVDQRLAVVGPERTRLLAERQSLLSRLRGAPDPAAPPLTGVAPAPGAGSGLEPDLGLGPGLMPASGTASEARPWQVQSTLLGLGALLLAVAGVVFAAVTYRSLGVAGRAAVLLGLTAAAGYAPVRLRARGLADSAEAVGAVALVLAVVDAWSLRRAGVGAGVDLRSYWAVATAVLTAAAAAYDAFVPLRVSRTAAVLLAQLPVLLVLDRAAASPAVVAVVVAGLAGADLLVAATLLAAAPRRAFAGSRSGRGAGPAVGCAGVLLLLATAASSVELVLGHRSGAAGLLAVAVVLGAASLPLTGRARLLVSAGPVPLVAAAAFAMARPGLPQAQQPLVLVAVALLALQVAALLPRPRREGPVAGALLVVVVALIGQAEEILQAVAAPLGWLTEPWTAAPARGARALVGPATTWSGTVVILVVLLGAGAVVLVAGVVLQRLREAAPPAAVLLGLGCLVLPVAVDASYGVGLAILVGLAGVAVAGWLAPRWRSTPSRALLLFAALAGGLASAWSLADRDATLTVLALMGLLAGAAARRAPAAACVAGLLVGAEVAAVGVARGLTVVQDGACLLPAAAVLLALSVATGLAAGLAAYRRPLEVAAGLLAATGTALAVADPGWLSWSLAADGLLALALALRADRRQIAVVGALLLSASSWVRLADAHVTAPEPYVLPLAAVALGLGRLRRRREPTTGSFAAYGPGLSLLLVPSLLASLSDPDPLRAVLLLPAAALVVLAGVAGQLRAPLAVGGLVLTVDALHLLSPYASALPRWSLLALVGTVLVVLGATYEQRRVELTRLRARFVTLG